jgi:hypothetical protein
LAAVGDHPRPYVVGDADPHAPRLLDVADLDLRPTVAEDALSAGLEAEPLGPVELVGAITPIPWAAAGATPADSVTRLPRSRPAMGLKLTFI